MPVGGLVPKVAEAQTAGRGQEMRQDKTETKERNREEETQRGRLDIIISVAQLYFMISCRWAKQKEFEVVHLFLKGVRVAPRLAASHSLNV